MILNFGTLWYSELETHYEVKRYLLYFLTDDWLIYRDYEVPAEVCRRETPR